VLKRRMCSWTNSRPTRHRLLKVYSDL